jgi:hypothetical protein
MQILLLLIIALLAVFWGLASISQSYATAQQAQAAIEASRAAQIASTGNLVTLVTIALVIIAMLVAVVVIAWLLLRAKVNPKKQWTPGPNANWGQISQPQANDLLPTLLTMLLYQMMQDKKQVEVAPMTMSEPEDEFITAQDDFWTM